MVRQTDAVTTVSSQPALSAAGRAYVAAVGSCGTIIFVMSTAVLAREGVPVQWAVFAILSLLAGRLTIKVPSVEASFAASEIFTFSCLLLFGPEAGVVTLVADALVLGWHRRMGWQRTFFNAGTLTLSGWIAGSLFFAWSGTQPLFGNPAPTVTLIFPLAILAAAFYAINTGLIAGAIAFQSGTPAFDIWRKHFLWLAPGYAASASVALLLVSALTQMNFGTLELVPTLLLVPPLFIVFYFTLRASFGRLEDAKGHVAALSKLYLSTVETLATAIDAKDEATHGHIRRVQIAAVALARELGVTDEQTIQAIEAAALLHDAGKIAIPEHILNKPGKLTAAEFEKMKLHAPIGAEMLAGIDFPYPVVPIVRHHHENWDGTGYPDRIAGTNIPLGARILSVVDCFDALTSDRPYRGRMTEEDSLQILRERRGSMYDPLIVDTFIRVHKQIMPAVDETSHPVARAVNGARTKAREEAVEQPDLPSPADVDAFVAAADDVLAVSSLERAIHGEASLSDAGALAWVMLRNVAPCVSMALFINDESQDAVVARFAAGAHAAALRSLRISRGAGIAGWSAANRRSVLNADPRLDLGLKTAAAEPRLRSALTLPLSHDGAVVAVLGLYATTANAFSEDHQRLLELLAPSLASSVAGAMTSRSLKASVPPVTHANPGLRLVQRS
jgi:putative nucleotidyltransferase with HDIG domain